MRYTVTAFINVGQHPFDGYEDGQTVATAPDLTFTVLATDHHDAAEAVWLVCQKVAADANGNRYPRDVRSFSIGDLLRVVPEGANPITRYLAARTAGFGEVDEPTNIRDLAGTHATSRRKETA